MAIIPRVKCSRCDRSYSGLQSRCPYCGARRSKGGKFGVPESGNPRWRLAVGVLLLVAIICTVIALVNIGTGEDTTTADASTTTSAGTTTSPDPSASASVSDAADVSPSPTVSAEEVPLETISAISVQWQFFSGTNEMTINVGDFIPLTAVITPSTADVTVTWTSDNKAVCTVDEAGNITAVGVGQVNIIAEYNGVQGVLVVRVS